MRRKREWAEFVWDAWRNSCPLDNVPDNFQPQFQQDLCDLLSANIYRMLQRFVLVARNESGGFYLPNMLYQLCASLQKVVNTTKSREGKFFNPFEYKEFANVIDKEMKRLRHVGLGSMTCV